MKPKARIFPVKIWDLREIVKLYHDVFFEVDPMFRVSRPDGLTRTLLDHTCEKWEEYFKVEGLETWMGVVVKGKIVAYAVWHTEGQVDLEYVPLGESKNDGKSPALKAASILNEEALKLDLRLKRVHIMEEEYLFLAPLLTAKEHRGKGYGRRLLEAGCRYARRENMKCYLMSLPGAKEFYLKMASKSLVHAKKRPGRRLMLKMGMDQDLLWVR